MPDHEVEEPDEFDVDGVPTHRRGAHRARPGVVTRWGPTVLTVATALAVLLLVVALLVLVGPSGLAQLVSGGWDSLRSAEAFALTG